MKNFMRLVLSLVVISLGSCDTAFLCAAQQPHKRKQEAEEPVGKKPRVEEREEKTDADREEKEPERMFVEGDAQQSASVSDSEDEDNYEPSEQIRALTFEVRDQVIRRYLSLSYRYDYQNERNSLMPHIKTVFTEHGIPATGQDCDYLCRVVEAYLYNYTYPMLAHFFDEYLLCDKDISFYATPGEIARFRLQGHAAMFDNTKGINAKKVMVDYLRRQDFGRNSNPQPVLQRLQSLHLSNQSIWWLSDLSPWYKKLFTRNEGELIRRDAGDNLVIDSEAAHCLIDQDIEVMTSVMHHEQEWSALKNLLSNDSPDMIAAGSKYNSLVNSFGDLRYRLHRFVTSLEFYVSAAELNNIYRDVIEKYASTDHHDVSPQARRALDTIRTRFGLALVPEEHCARLFDCWVISAFCNELIKKMHETCLDQMLQEFVDKVMEFEIQHAGKVGQQIINDLNNKKKILLDEFSKIKRNTFKAYTKALLRTSLQAQEIIVSSNEISDPQHLLNPADEENSICQKIRNHSDIWRLIKPITMSYLSDNGFDHSGISRTMNTLLARSFLSDAFCSFNGKFFLPKSFSEVAGTADQKDLALSAFGTWLAIVFVNNIAVPLSLPSVFYAGLKKSLPLEEDCAAIIKWAAYLKSYDENLFNNYSRTLFQVLLHGTVADLRTFCREKIGWEENDCLAITDQNKFNKVLHEIILPIFSFDPQDVAFGKSYMSLQNNFTFLNETPKVFSEDNSFSEAFAYINDDRHSAIVTYDYLKAWEKSCSEQKEESSSEEDEEDEQNVEYSLFCNLLFDLFSWLSPYDLAHFFPQSIEATDLAAHLEFNKTDVAAYPLLAHAADVFEQALREYINENRDNQEKLEKLVNYFSGSPVYQGQQLKVQFAKNQNYDENAHTCYHTVQINLGTVNEQGVVIAGRALAYHERDAAFKATTKELIGAWGGDERFGLEQQLDQARNQLAAILAPQPI